MEQSNTMSKSENAGKAENTSERSVAKPRKRKSKPITKENALIILQSAMNALQEAEIQVEGYPKIGELQGCFLYFPTLTIDESGKFVELPK